MTFRHLSPRQWAVLRRLLRSAEPVRMGSFVRDEFGMWTDPRIHPPKTSDYAATKHRNERLNVLAAAVTEAWGWQPLSVRYGAAEAADAFVESLMEERELLPVRTSDRDAVVSDPVEGRPGDRRDVPGVRDA